MLLEWLFGDSNREARDGGNLENPDVAWNDPKAWEAAFGMGTTGTGETVTTAKALSVSPVWKAVKMISGDVAKLPLEVFARDDGGKGKSKDTAHPAFDLIGPYGMANEETTSLQFWRAFVVSMLLFENGYAWIERDNAGRPLGLYNLLPDRTTIVRKNGRKWILTEVGGKLEPLPWSDCLHVPGLTHDAVSGCELVTAAREDIAQVLAARNFTSKFFANGLHAGGVLQVPPGASPKAKRKVEAAVNERSGQDKAFKTMVLRDGFKWFQTMVDPQRAALVEINDQKIRDVANFFLLWPGHLGMKDSISYNSIEQQRRDYYDTTLTYHCAGIRAECNAKLIDPTDRRERKRFIDYNVNALLWADAETVATIGYGGVGAGVLTPDEVRGWWNLEPLPDGVGTTTRVPLNTAPAPAGDTANGGGSGRSGNVSDDLAAALREVVRDVATRCVTRWAIHHERAAKRGGGAKWLAEELPTHDAVVVDMFGPVRAAAVACGWSTSDQWIPDLRAAFTTRATVTTLDTQAVEDLVSAFIERTEL